MASKSQKNTIEKQFTVYTSGLYWRLFLFGYKGEKVVNVYFYYFDASRGVTFIISNCILFSLLVPANFTWPLFGNAFSNVYSK